MKKKHKFLIAINMFRIILVYFFFKHNKFKDKCKMDLEIWKKTEGMESYSDFISLGYFLTSRRELRNVVLNRLHRNPIKWFFVRMFFSPEKTLYINMPPEKIGGGIYIQHGFSTIIAAKEIGENFHVNQQVTIGYNGQEAPIIRNNVKVTAGAIVIGNVTIGNNTTVGAGAVVIKDVPENTVVAGVPAKVVKIIN